MVDHQALKECPRSALELLSCWGAYRLALMNITTKRLDSLVLLTNIVPEYISVLAALTFFAVDAWMTSAKNNPVSVRLRTGNE